jgi:hypothetical protein
MSLCVAASELNAMRHASGWRRHVNQVPHLANPGARSLLPPGPKQASYPALQLRVMCR